MFPISGGARQHAKAVTGARHRIEERKGREREQRPGPRRPSQRGRRSGDDQHPTWGGWRRKSRPAARKGGRAGIRNANKAATVARHRMAGPRPGPRRPSRRGRRSGADQPPTGGLTAQRLTGIPQGRPEGIRNANKAATGARHRSASARRNGGAASAREARATRARARSIRCP